MDLGALFEQMQADVASFVFRQEDWTCSEEEMKENDKQMAEKWAHEWIAHAQKRYAKLEKWAHEWIAHAQKRYAKPEKQAKELLFWCGFLGGFPHIGIHALPLLVAEIRNLEGERK